MPYLALVWRREESPADALRMLILAHSVNAAPGVYTPDGGQRVATGARAEGI